MQTPDEIKKGLESCSSDECNGDHVGCPYIKSEMCMMDMANDALAYIKQLEQRLASVGKTCPEWISVEDRLPETDNLDTRDYNVLLWIPKREGCRQNGIYLGKILKVKPDTDGSKNFWGIRTPGSEWTVWGWGYFEEPIPTHWMPLPEPPKEE